MILLLGASGYVGQAFASAMRRRGEPFIPLSRQSVDYTRFDILFDYVRKVKPRFVINAAGYVGKPNADACELARAETVQGNTLFPQTVARVCFMMNIPWGHVSSGSIYSGAKVMENGRPHVEKDLSQPWLQQLFDNNPERFCGFTEMDEPNFSFRHPPCNFYSGTKALAEEALAPYNQTYIWRMRRPFDEVDHPRNFLSKIQGYAKVQHSINSLSHLGEFVSACLDLRQMEAPFGIYNVVNPGAIGSAQVVDIVRRRLSPSRPFHFWRNDEEFYEAGVMAQRSNCILDTAKLLHVGVKLRPVQEAIEDSLRRWQPGSHPAVRILPFGSEVKLCGMTEPSGVAPLQG